MIQLARACHILTLTSERFDQLLRLASGAGGSLVLERFSLPGDWQNVPDEEVPAVMARGRVGVRISVSWDVPSAAHFFVFHHEEAQRFFHERLRHDFSHPIRIERTEKGFRITALPMAAFKGFEGAEEEFAFELDTHLDRIQELVPRDEMFLRKSVQAVFEAVNAWKRNGCPEGPKPPMLDLRDAGLELLPGAWVYAPFAWTGNAPFVVLDSSRYQLKEGERETIIFSAEGVEVLSLASFSGRDSLERWFDDFLESGQEKPLHELCLFVASFIGASVSDMDIRAFPWQRYLSF